MGRTARFLLSHAIDDWAERTPDQEAVRFESASLSYAELARKSSQLAGLLTESGVQRGDRVGIYMNKALGSAIGLYGIMKAGAAYVPLDPLAPVDRLRFVIGDCGIRHLISQPEKVETLREILMDPQGVHSVIGIPEEAGLPAETVAWETVFSMPEAAGGRAVIEQDLAYILYTSGSTGVPKGIMHTHRSGLSFAEWSVATYGLRPEDRLSSHAPLHFDLSTFDFFAGAIAGATTVIIPEALTKFPASLSKLMQDAKLTVWYSVPFALIQLLLHGNLAARELGSLRWILFAGEPFPTKHLCAVMSALPLARFSNLYGPTETNVCTYYHLPGLPEDAEAPIPIGRPCANVEALVVDGDSRPVVAGETGELLIRGGVVMNGYWGQPDKTERGFYRRKSPADTQDVFYRTGDLVRELPSGDFAYLGRKDRQVKTRGYRVELDEIEVALLSHAGVEEAAAYPIPDGQGSNLIEAAVVPKAGVHLTPHQVIEHLAGRLPPYAIPSRLVVTDGFPRTSTGKIDRRALQSQAAPVASV